MIKNYHRSVEINHNPIWPDIPDSPYKILIIDGSGSSKINVLLNLIKHQRLDIDKACLYIKDQFESKYQLFINGREKVGIKRLKFPTVFIDYSQITDHVYKNLEDYNPIKKTRMLIVFDDMIADMESNKFYCYWIVFKRKKTQYFACFYIAVLFQSA